MSVVVPAYRAERTLRRCIDHLLDQDLDAPYEVILVVSADEPSGLPADLPRDPRLTVLRRTPRVEAAAARNAGVAVARAPWIAFVDADALASRSWLRTLLEHAPRATVVAGGVRNGTPRSVAGTAEYLVEFSDVHPRRPAPGAWHGVTCNLLVHRSAWERFGPFPEGLGGGEDTLFTTAAADAGTFRFAGDATVTHLNRTDPRTVIRHQAEAGRYTARIVRRALRYRGRLLVRHPALVPLAVVARAMAVTARAARFAADGRLRALASTPVAVAALVAWGWGAAAEGRRLDAGAGRQNSRRSGRRRVRIAGRATATRSRTRTR